MAEKLRILFWQEYFPPYIGGAEVLAPKLMAGLHERGFEFVVVTRQDDLERPAKANWGGVPVYRYPFGRAFTTGNIEQLVRMRSEISQLKQRFAPDLVHMNLIGFSALFHHDTARAHWSPLLVTLHSQRAAADTQANLLRKTLLTAEWINCVSTAVRRYWVQQVPEISKYSSVIYNGFRPSERPLESLPMQPSTLLCLGRLAPEKGFDLAIAALVSIRAKFPGVRLVIAGDGPERTNLQRQVETLHLNDIVDFTGWVDQEEVPHRLDAATIVIIPSHHEGLPSVALQAALRARPVIATTVGGIPEIVLHEKTGFLIERGNSWALAQAIEHLLGNPEKATALGIAAQRRAQEVFDFERYVDAYAALYSRLIATKDVSS